MRGETFKMEYELYHHGVLGMKWGIRRYQNKDGSLTSAGRKRYNSMSAKKLHKELKKSIQRERAKQYGGSGRWMYNAEIGEKSKALRQDRERLKKEYESSKAYKNWLKKMDNLEAEERNITDPNVLEEYDKKFTKLYKEKPKPNFNDLSFSISYTIKDGKQYTDDFINRGGRDLSIARLQDLGYSQKDAEHFVDRMAKRGYTLGDV